MICNKLFCFTLILLTVLNYADSQVCTVRLKVSETSTERRTVSSYETYSDYCFLDFDPDSYSEYHDYTYNNYGMKMCKKQRLVWNTKPVVIRKEIYKTGQKCCLGYKQVNTSSSQSIQCEPICYDGCENGFCEQPNVCNCFEGYKKVHIFWPKQLCIPICNVCINGKCVSPNTCKCNDGYDSINGTCEPICSDSCINGVCTAPETCNCLPGFRKSNSSICEPYCSMGCENGECIAPEICNCLPGFRKSNSSICEPYCSMGCDNGECIAPETCNCLPGFRKSNSSICEPYCSMGCDNGECIAPETCNCLPGFRKSNSSICEPYCSMGCDSGECIAPETCICLPGFTKSNSNVCEPHCSIGCEHGDCVAPETCHCNPGWFKYMNTLNVDTCRPVCNEICVNESCVPPDDCICKPGYFKSERNQCSFYCSKCSFGKCVGIEKCACSAQWELNENGTDCIPQIVQTTGTVFKSTLRTTTLSNVIITTDKNILQEDYSTVASLVDSTPELKNIDYRVTDSIYEKDALTKTEENASKNQNGLYILLGIFVLFIVISMVILIIFKNKILGYFKGSKYVVEDYPKHEVPETFVNVSFSSVQRDD